MMLSEKLLLPERKMYERRIGRSDFHFSPILETEKNQDAGDKSTSELQATE